MAKESREMKQLIRTLEMTASLRWLIVNRGDATVEEVDETIRTKGVELFKEYDPRTLERAEFVAKSIVFLLTDELEKRKETADV